MNMMKMKSDEVSIVHSQVFFLLVNPSFQRLVPLLLSWEV